MSEAGTIERAQQTRTVNGHALTHFCMPHNTTKHNVVTHTLALARTPRRAALATLDAGEFVARPLLQADADPEGRLVRDELHLPRRPQEPLALRRHRTGAVHKNACVCGLVWAWASERMRASVRAYARREWVQESGGNGQKRQRNWRGCRFSKRPRP